MVDTSLAHSFHVNDDESESSRRVTAERGKNIAAWREDCCVERFSGLTVRPKSKSDARVTKGSLLVGSVDDGARSKINVSSEGEANVGKANFLGEWDDSGCILYTKRKISESFSCRGGLHIASMMRKPGRRHKSHMSCVSNPYMESASALSEERELPTMWKMALSLFCQS
jgi:hypothetical protein